jgi:oxygen-dependent protoporphyrinogen oxidase
MNEKKIIVVIGAGISGLTTAYLLYKKKKYEVVVLEQNQVVGGSIESFSENGFLFDRGPNSALETTPVIGYLVNELDIKEDLLYANKKGNKRYILRDNQLHPLPMSPPAFIKTKLFSAKAKLRLFAEPFIGRSQDGYYQSIADFVTRRLGKEFLDYAINPFVAGVYAGKPEDLSVKSAFPKLYALEEKYGGLIVGTVKSIRERKKRAEVSKQSAKMISFKDGMNTLPNAISKALGKRVLTSSTVKEIVKEDSGFKVVFDLEGSLKSIKCNAVISTVPSYLAGPLFSKFDHAINKHFDEIYYPPVLVYYLVYNKENIKQPLDGFGFLIPSKEKKSFLGAIWSSVIFPGRTEDDKAAFTLFIGGARNPEFVDLNREDLLKLVKKEFEELMKINGDPVYEAERFWEKAIPQYNLGYIEHEKYFDDFEKNNPGLFLSGNYRGGISVGDCIKNAEVVAEKADSTLSGSTESS